MRNSVFMGILAHVWVNISRMGLLGPRRGMYSAFADIAEQTKRPGGSVPSARVATLSFMS